jgi:SAM-dependent methyltransferase
VGPGDPPGGTDGGALGAAYWDDVSATFTRQSHYMDAFVAALKTRAYLALLARWGWDAQGPQLKTDLFEESTGVDALLWRMPPAGLRIGMDLSPSAAARAARNAPAGTLAAVACDARRLPFAANSLVRILSPSTLDHFQCEEDLHTSLCELRRVLKPGGRLVITLANRGNVGDPLLRLAIRLGLAPYHIGSRYTAQELRRELEAAGLAVCDVTAIVHHPRLMATGVAWLARHAPWRPLVGGMQRLLLWMQRLENTRLRYATGCFVAALAIKTTEERT